MTSLLDAAHALGSAGWPVFPCRGKVPLTEHGHLDGTTDAVTIRRWWQQWPRANIGARVPDSLLVIDTDPRNNVSVDADLAGAVGTLTDTLTCWSGRGDGGRHRYYLRPPGAFTSKRLPAGVDLKVLGYCMVPPSTHLESGRVYSWELRPVAPLPTRLRELLRPAPRPPRRVFKAGGAPSTRGLLRVVAEAQEGERNCALFWAACRAAESGALPQVETDLLDAAESAGLPKRDALRTIASAARTVGGSR